MHPFLRYEASCGHWRPAIKFDIDFAGHHRDVCMHLNFDMDTGHPLVTGNRM